MATIQVHPHFGYLNSDFRLGNGSESNLLVTDSNDGVVYEIPALGTISVRLKAGTHRFTVSGDEHITETVIVEDAIKLGGSREKKSFIFEGTPWALMVMLDRTYFYNRETKEQYIEHCLAPNDIKFLTPNYLLFTTDKDNSIFTLDNLSVEKTIAASTYLYSNDHFAIFSSQDGLILYSLDRCVETRLTSLSCDDFAIDKTQQALYYHLKDKEGVLIKRLDDTDAKEKLYEISETFRCFVGDYSAVFGYSPQSLSVMDLRTKESTKLYEDIFPVITVNGKGIWKNNAYDIIDTNDVKNSFTSYAELTIYESPGRWLFNVKTRHLLKNNGTIRDKVKNIFYSTTVGGLLKSDQPMTLTNGKSFDCITDNTDNNYLVFGDKIRGFKGYPIVSPSGYMLIATNGKDSSKILVDPLVPSFKHPSDGLATESLFRKTGLIKVISTLEDGNEKIEFRDIEKNKVYAQAYYEDLDKGGFYRLSGGAQDFIHSKEGLVRPMPCTKDRLIAISERFNYALVRSEEGVVINGYDSNKKEWVGAPLGEIIIDKSFYSKAVFCSDGENIIYQKKGKEFFLREIGSEEESVFDPQGSIIRRNINGYIPYLDFDTHRKPVYVDPVTLNRIEAAAAGQFTYQSIDGKIKHVAHNVVKYYSYEKKQEVSSEEYKSYVTKYDWIEVPLSASAEAVPGPEEAKSNRELYYAANKDWLNKKDDSLTLETFLKVDSVCDRYIFRKDYYVREMVDGKILDVELPQALYFLNYVSYSYDNRYIIISGRFPMGSLNKGLAMIYDVQNQKAVYQSTSTRAVWLGVFSKKGMVAYYDSVPRSFVSDNIEKEESYRAIFGRSFLTFSPSGKYIALSCQGYIPYCSGDPHWGHQPSCDVYVVRSEEPNNEIAHFSDHGDRIEGISWDRANSSVASATFSKDDRKLMTVSKDGVVVVRNLHFEDEEDAT